MDKSSTEPRLMADCDSSGSFCPEKERRGWSSGVVTEEHISDGPWSQRSISRSLQRAEMLLRSTFNPSLKWLFHCHCQDEEQEERNFVVAHNLVSRSSARLLRLQQALLTVAPQWPVCGGGCLQAHVKGLPAEGGVLLLPSLSSLQGNYGVLWKLLKQRSLLLFIHEYTRRARLTAAYISTLNHLLEYEWKKPPQSPSSWSSLRVSLGSLSQELRVHLNHWSCLCSKVQSDRHLRAALVQRTRMLVEIKKTLELLGLHALLLMERYVFVVLSALAQTEFDSVPREVLEDILAGTDLYNQAVYERAQHSSTPLMTALLQQAYYSSPNSPHPNSKGHHPTAISVKELMIILATHHADMAAMQLQYWASNQSYNICHMHTNHKENACSDHCCGTSASPSEWTGEELQFTCQTSHKTPPVHISDCNLDSSILENHHPGLGKPSLVLHQTEDSDKDQTGLYDIYQTLPAQSSMEALLSGQQNIERQNTTQLQTISPSSATFHSCSALPLSGLCQQNYSSAEQLFKQPFSSTDLLFPSASHMPAPEPPTQQLLLPNTMTDGSSANGKIAELVELNPTLSKNQPVEGPEQEVAEVEMTAEPDGMFSSAFGSIRDEEKEKSVEVAAEGSEVERRCPHWPHSVQWSDHGQALLFDELFRQYGALLWTLCSRALWVQLHVPQARRHAASANLQDSYTDVLLRISQDSDVLPHECRAMLEGLRLRLLAVTAHAQWDYVACKSLGSALKDKCLNPVMTSSQHDRGGKMSATMTHFQMLPPPLLASLHQSNSTSTGYRFKLQRHTVSLTLATVQLMTVWVMSKAYQFLSSWSLSSFLLITQGDLKVLNNSLEMMLHRTRSLIMNPNGDHPSLCNHNQLLLMEQLRALESVISKLQAFSSVVLKTFSSDCKRMSGELFEQTMPSAIYWRTNLKTGFPSSASQYASLAAQTVIGQVLEGVAPLPDDARVQALSITMTAFMEAWMEHILKQKIKFSVQGALQLKQDFDSIRELMGSERYGLSAELHQQLLSLRVFQQVDSAVVCLLQQPQAKPYLPSRAWEPFTHCCPSNSSRHSVDAVVGCGVTNLRGVDGEDLTQSDPSVNTTDLPPVDPSNPGEPYLAPSLVLGTAQQEWLDLRIHSSARRWRLPGLQCFSKSES